MTGKEDAVEAANRMTEALETVGDQLTRYNKGSRTRDGVLAASIILDLLLTVLLVFVYGTAHTSQAATRAEHASLISGCVAGNVFRAENVLLWDHLAAISKPPAHSTKRERAADKTEIAGLLTYIRHTFAPRDCARDYRLP